MFTPVNLPKDCDFLDVVIAGILGICVGLFFGSSLHQASLRVATPPPAQAATPPTASVALTYETRSAAAPNAGPPAEKDCAHVVIRPGECVVLKGP